MTFRCSSAAPVACMWAFICGAMFCVLGSCTGDSTVSSLRLEYDHNEAYSVYGNIYVAWIESADGSYRKTLTACERLLGPDPDDGTTITNRDEVLPYWHLNTFPLEDADAVDAVAGPTIRSQDFSLSFALPDDVPRSFNLCYETDVSFNSNDWFSDQPAVLYKVAVDLDKGAGSYPLELSGWTPHSNNIDDARAATGNQSLSSGTLQTELRCISSHAASPNSPVAGNFGDDDVRSQARMIQSLVVHVE